MTARNLKTRIKKLEASRKHIADASRVAPTGCGGLVSFVERDLCLRRPGDLPGMVRGWAAPISQMVQGFAKPKQGREGFHGDHDQPHP